MLRENEEKHAVAERNCKRLELVEERSWRLINLMTHHVFCDDCESDSDVSVVVHSGRDWGLTCKYVRERYKFELALSSNRIVARGQSSWS